MQKIEHCLLSLYITVEHNWHNTKQQEMRRLLFVILAMLGISIMLTSCKVEYSDLSIWGSETMTFDGDTVDIKYKMNYEEYYDSYLEETICVLSKSLGGGEWLDTYFVRKDDKLYESKYCLSKYLIKKDAVTGKTTRTKNIFWQKRVITIEDSPEYSVVQKGDRLELTYNSGTKYCFLKKNNSISL